MSAFQALLFVVIVAVPLWLMATRDGPKLLAWVIAVICVDVFNTKGGVNISAATVTGLLLVPYSGKLLLAFRRAPIVPWLAAHFAHLALLGLAFGLVFPWPDLIGRPLNLRAEGRTVLYLMREAASLSVAVFVGQQIAKAGHPRRLLNGILIGASVTGAFAVLEYLTGISYYLLFNEGVLAPTYWNFRVRGLNFEPRGLGLIGAHALVIGVLYLGSRYRVRMALATLGVTAAGMFLSGSTSGLLASAAGGGVVSLANRRVRRHLLRVVLATTLVAGVIAYFQWNRVAVLTHLLVERVGTTVRYGPAANGFEEIVYRMEIYDTSAALFLAAHPVYLVVGTGPGLMSLPATPFMPVSPYTLPYVVPGLNSPPTMGFMLELANGGLVSIILWFGFVLTASRSLEWATQLEGPHQRTWILARWSFLAAAAIYILAAGFLSSIWSLFVGVGLGAAFMREWARTLATEAHAA